MEHGEYPNPILIPAISTSRLVSITNLWMAIRLCLCLCIFFGEHKTQGQVRRRRRRRRARARQREIGIGERKILATSSKQFALSYTTTINCGVVFKQTAMQYEKHQPTTCKDFNI
jgi:hypothetical protein